MMVALGGHAKCARGTSPGAGVTLEIDEAVGRFVLGGDDAFRGL